MYQRHPVLDRQEEVCILQTMKIVKKNFLISRKCEFGDFELQPDDGWKISEQFIDYESKLLYVSTSDLNERNWTSFDGGARSIPNKRYIIDPVACRILQPNEWSRYFSYDPQEFISADGKFKLITTRVHDASRNFDSIQEKLINLESGAVSTGTSVAFTQTKRENMLESMYRSQHKQHERAMHLLKMHTLESLHEQEIVKLIQDDVIIAYFNTDQIFRLSYTGLKFRLECWKAKWQREFKFPEEKASILDYDKLEDYVSTFLNTKRFYIDNQVLQGIYSERARMILKKFVKSYMNDLRKDHNFSYEEYEKLNDWENFFYEHDSVKPSEYKQYCSNCAKVIRYTPRYPKCICQECASKKIVDENRVELDFANVGFSGGLKIIYKDGDKILKEDTTQFKKHCFIDGREFIATEARFGGIVIQAVE